jgi:DNA end-binding protein Ku
MAPHPYRKGYLKLSLVSFPIKLFPATANREKIRFHQINRKSGNRIKCIKVDVGTGEPVDDEDIVRGYEFGRGRYLEITNEELEAVAAQGRSTNSSQRTRSMRYIGLFLITSRPMILGGRLSR